MKAIRWSVDEWTEEKTEREGIQRQRHKRPTALLWRNEKEMRDEGEFEKTGGRGEERGGLLRGKEGPKKGKA